MLDFVFTNQFKKDLKLMEKRRKNMDKIYEIMALLIWEEPLPEYCREHKLHGNLEGLWDCHVEGNWVILYELREENIFCFYRNSFRFALTSFSPSSFSPFPPSFNHH